MFPQVTRSPDLNLLDKKIAPLVAVINELGLSTYYSCEGHGNERGLIQYPYPMVVIDVGSSEEDMQALIRFIGMLGIHNTNCRSHGDVWWTLTPSGNCSKQLTLKPDLLDRYPLGVMHKGIKALTKVLKQMNKWYEVK